MRALVVLPTYNEAENVLPLGADVLAQDARLDVLVVDDASPDGTGDLVETARRSEPRLHLLRRPGKLGLGTAYLDGFRHGLERGYDRVLTMDCDYSHHPRYLPHMLEVADQADLVIGSRYVAGGGVANWPLRRRALSRFANFYTRWACCACPCATAPRDSAATAAAVLEVIDPFGGARIGLIRSSRRWSWRVHHAGFSIREIPIVFEDRRRGSSKIDQVEILRAARHVMATAFRRPNRRGAQTPAQIDRSSSSSTTG
jgi:dolichol-phosphate mannosyltransferase